MKYLLGFIGLMLALSVGGLAVRALFFPVHVANQYANTAEGVVDKTLNADNAIFNYEWFKQQYEDIQAGKQKILNAQAAVESFNASAGPRTGWTFEDKQEGSRLGSVVLGLQNHQEQLIADYNAHAKEANRAIFQNSVLPGFIDSFTFLKQ